MAASQKPLQDAVLCCTSIPQDVRTRLTDMATQMGASLKLDLTSEVTHLIVGNINTPKYQYTAKERPDIKSLLPEFVYALREKWMEGGDVDVEALEKMHACPVFMRQNICITGFETMEERKALEEMVATHGATYRADLTKDVTHLVAAKCVGAKYNYAKQWGIHVVSHKWLTDSLQRGMALQESLYAPELEIADQGVGAFRIVRAQSFLGKRKSEGENGINDENRKRKMRRVASARLETHSQDMWQDISTKEAQVEATELNTWDDDSQTINGDQPPRLKPADIPDKARHSVIEEPHGVFAGHYVLIHGFDKAKTKRLSEYLTPNGAIVVLDVDELESASENAFYKERCLLVPHAKPDVHSKLPDVPPATLSMSEWWVERCIHYKQYLDPYEDPLSQPFWDVIGSEFADLSISTTGFTGVTLRQTAEAVKIMGATYHEKILPSTSVLVAGSEPVRREKALYASKHKIPVVSVGWLWESLSTRQKASFDKHRVTLPAFNSSELGRESSSSSPSETSRRVPGAYPERPDDQRPKRLSGGRKRHTTPSLLLGPSRPKLVPQRGPFIHEDEDVDEPVLPAAVPIPEDPPQKSSTSHSGPLQERSPNTSQQKNERSPQKIDNTDHMIEEIRKPISRSPKKAVSHTKLSVGKEAPETHSGSTRPQEELTANLASILARQMSRSDSTVSSEPLRRKNRPLGRNLSGLSNRSGSGISPSAVGTPDEDPSDEFRCPRVEVDMPSTQLGYETPEAEAHRLQMSKKMGLTLDVQGGRRIESGGTVKDIVGGEGRRAAARTKGGRLRS